MKIRPVGAELFHADGRTDGRKDVAKLIVVFFFSQFCESALKISLGKNEMSFLCALQIETEISKQADI
jgi:hypothetical protein